MFLWWRRTSAPHWWLVTMGLRLTKVLSRQCLLATNNKDVHTRFEGRMTQVLRLVSRHVRCVKQWEISDNAAPPMHKRPCGFATRQQLPKTLRRLALLYLEVAVATRMAMVKLTYALFYRSHTNASNTL